MSSKQRKKVHPSLGNVEVWEFNYDGNDSLIHNILRYSKATFQVTDYNAGAVTFYTSNDTDKTEWTQQAQLTGDGRVSFEREKWLFLRITASGGYTGDVLATFGGQ